jgi:hypothetical protein
MQKRQAALVWELANLTRPVAEPNDAPAKHQFGEGETQSVAFAFHGEQSDPQCISLAHDAAARRNASVDMFLKNET